MSKLLKVTIKLGGTTKEVNVYKTSKRGRAAYVALDVPWGYKATKAKCGEWGIPPEFRGLKMWVYREAQIHSGLSNCDLKAIYE